MELNLAELKAEKERIEGLSVGELALDRETALVLIAQLITHEDLAALAPVAVQNAEALHATPRRTSRFRGNWGRT
jgi:hypothetical protein